MIRILDLISQPPLTQKLSYRLSSTHKGANKNGCHHDKTTNGEHIVVITKIKDLQHRTCHSLTERVFLMLLEYRDNRFNRRSKRRRARHIRHRMSSSTRHPRIHNSSSSSIHSHQGNTFNSNRKHRQCSKNSRKTNPTTTATTEASVPATSPTLKGTLQNISARFTSPTAENTNKPNMGFTPTPAMVKRHEQHHKAEPPRPLYQFQVTKLRTWRTGYVRLLCLYPTTFCTIDPDYSHQVTNTWSFTNFTDWLAIPKEKDVILLQVGNDKLKLKCHDVDRSVVLTALLECKFQQGSRRLSTL